MAFLAGRVVVITGGARGQGRAHALAVAREGAAVVLLDIATDMATVPYPLASLGDLEETVALVEGQGAMCIAEAVDLRDRPATDRALARAANELGGIDALIVNHGIQSFSLLEDMSYAM
jgi:NAD(P)-dependent dehydrogenase (short-subunit alcohol dehydrogenase family)